MYKEQNNNPNMNSNMNPANCYGISYTVKRGDTLYSISRRYNIAIAQILRANPFVDVYNLQIGEEICIPIANSGNAPSLPEVGAVPIPITRNFHGDNDYDENAAYQHDDFMPEMINGREAARGNTGAGMPSNTSPTTGGTPTVTPTPAPMPTGMTGTMPAPTPMPTGMTGAMPAPTSMPTGMTGTMPTPTPMPTGMTGTMPTPMPMPTRTVAPTTPAPTPMPTRTMAPTTPAPTPMPTRTMAPTMPPPTPMPTRTVAPTMPAPTPMPTRTVAPTMPAPTPMPTRTVAPTMPAPTPMPTRTMAPTMPTPTPMPTRTMAPTMPTPTPMPTRTMAPTMPAPVPMPSTGLSPSGVNRNQITEQPQRTGNMQGGISTTPISRMRNTNNMSNMWEMPESSGYRPMPLPQSPMQGAVRPSCSSKKCTTGSMAVYVIKDRDTINDILEYFGIELEDLLQMNQLCDIMLKPGMAINVPVFERDN